MGDIVNQEWFGQDDNKQAIGIGVTSPMTNQRKFHNTKFQIWVQPSFHFNFVTLLIRCQLFDVNTDILKPNHAPVLVKSK
jgi:hypothetical protein